VLMNVVADDVQGQARIAAFREVLQQSGWSDGRNVRVDVRWGENEIERERQYAVELVALAPDVILAAGTQSVLAFQKATRTTPGAECIAFIRVFLRLLRTVSVKVSLTPGLRRQPRAPTAGVREAPRHEIAGGGAPELQQRLWGFRRVDAGRERGEETFPVSDRGRMWARRASRQSRWRWL